MRTLGSIVAVLLAATVLPALGVAGQTGILTTLSKLRNHARVLLIFAPDARDPQYLAQLGLLQAETAEITDRDLVAVAVLAQGPGPSDALLSEKMLTEADAAAARKRFHVGPAEFVVILLGKDGGEKLRSENPISFERLRAVIDAMPMRQEEMKGKVR